MSKCFLLIELLIAIPAEFMGVCDQNFPPVPF